MDSNPILVDELSYIVICIYFISGKTATICSNISIPSHLNIAAIDNFYLNIFKIIEILGFLAVSLVLNSPYITAAIWYFLSTRHTVHVGAQWLSGRVLDSRLRGRGFEPHRRHCVVVLEQDTFILA